MTNRVETVRPTTLLNQVALVMPSELKSSRILIPSPASEALLQSHRNKPNSTTTKTTVGETRQKKNEERKSGKMQSVELQIDQASNISKRKRSRDTGNPISSNETFDMATLYAVAASAIEEDNEQLFLEDDGYENFPRIEWSDTVQCTRNERKQANNCCHNDDKYYCDLFDLSKLLVPSSKRQCRGLLRSKQIMSHLCSLSE